MDKRRKLQRGVDSGGTYAVLAMMALLTGLLSLTLGASFFGLPMFAAYFGDPFLVLLNLIPPLLLTYFLYFVTGRAWAAVLAASVIILGLSAVGFIKLAVTLTPFTASDISLSDWGDSARQSLVFDWRLAAVVIFIAAGSFFTFHLTGRGLVRQAKLRLAGIAALIAIAALLYGFVYTSDTVYGLASADYPIDRSSATQSYIARGSIYPFIHSIPAAFDGGIN